MSSPVCFWEHPCWDTLPAKCWCVPSVSLCLILILDPAPGPGIYQLCTATTSPTAAPLPRCGMVVASSRCGTMLGPGSLQLGPRCSWGGGLKPSLAPAPQPESRRLGEIVAVWMQLPSAWPWCVHREYNLAVDMLKPPSPCWTRSNLFQPMACKRLLAPVLEYLKGQ